MTAVTPGHQLALKHRSVLVVDENPQARKLVADLCRAIGFGTVRAVRSTAAASAQLSETPFDVVLCDWGIAQPDGPELVRSVRSSANATLRDTPIVLLKVAPAQNDVVAARAAGATKLLARPFSTQALIDAMKQIFRDA